VPNISFGERLRRARDRKDITQGDLAGKVGVEQSTISNWERERFVPSPEEKARLKKVLEDTWTEASANRNEDAAPPQPSPFSSWLTCTRIERKISVPELAEMTDLSLAAIYNIEAGRTPNPRAETVKKLETALKEKVPAEAKVEASEDATIKGVGELFDFDPHNEDDLPSVSGIYVLYDISERPIYVGQGANIKSRILDHGEKFWFKQPIVETGAYVKIEDKSLREKVETLLIRFLKSNAVINKQKVDR
jgi:transcriptional regulator with XRE-family HTH domain